MDIEISIRVGERSVSDSGSVKWNNFLTDSILVTATTENADLKNQAIKMVNSSLNFLLNELTVDRK